MTEKAKRGDLIRDVGIGLTLAISFGSAAMTVFDRTTGSAKSAEQLDGRVKALERVQSEHGAVLRVRGGFIRDAREQINFLCQTQAECRRLYSRIPATE